MHARSLINRLFENEAWFPLGDGYEYRLNQNWLTIFVPQAAYENYLPVRKKEAERLALAKLQDPKFPVQATWTLQDSSESLSSLHPGSDNGWDVTFWRTEEAVPGKQVVNQIDPD